MQATLTRTQLSELTQTIEDSVACICNEQMLSGELVWTIVHCLATAKTNEFHA